MHCLDMGIGGVTHAFHHMITTTRRRLKNSRHRHLPFRVLTGMLGQIVHIQLKQSCCGITVVKGGFIVKGAELWGQEGNSAFLPNDLPLQ